MSASAENALSGEQRIRIFWTPHKHRTLAVVRLEPVYGPEGKEFRVPRYLQ
jgi:hypothetical protein